VSGFYPYDFDHRFAPMWLAFGAWPGRDGVTVTDDELRATFGLLSVATPRDNVAGAHITRDYRWWTAIGARASLVDDGLTFGTNHRAGVCIHFRTNVRRVMGLKDHSALTVTVADVDGLTAVLGSDDSAPDR
jgi:hypothetical protein